ncbi:DNA polymerase III subunit gamma/tau [Candidatus Bandiella euplotis]|uniref:DNA polymerase III subunit gamma/tau n=1 Tax=Candidatus Bandiella euplotis TaxID=1664265 RepID=UPI002B257011|nr:DNA polymerase III subunit gamma/tau [Candidatus Bandiella woodruffii]
MFGDSGEKKLEYRVLARKYRPRVFKDLIAQEHVVRIIENSIKNNKIHHAYVLTGIRGVGKTTFARILAKALNCAGQGDVNPVIEPCLQCSNCMAIEESRHQDVIEIDAASNTGVGDIREIIENAKYRPIIARYKVYIIDEVHMLSNSAFNALLKTLEEPPEHVKFVLATTEIKKIPLTVISRCQRLDLYRFTLTYLAEHLVKTAKKEGYTLADGAAKLLAKAAQGSARDGLSLLDQAMLVSEGVNIELSSVTNMLGMVSLEYIYDIFNAIIDGDVKKPLGIVKNLYEKGAEPSMILQELIEITHKASLCKIGDMKELILSDYELANCKNLSERLSVVTLSRLWQMFNKSLVEMKSSHNEFYTLEMTIIRIVYANLLISPEDILKDLGKNSDYQPQEEVKKKRDFQTIDDLFAILEEKMEMMLCHTIKHDLFIVEFKMGYMKIDASNSLQYNKQELLKKLKAATGIDWVIESNNLEPGINYGQEEDKRIKAKKDHIKNNSLVKEILKSFPETEISDIRLTNE